MQRSRELLRSRDVAIAGAGVGNGVTDVDLGVGVVLRDAWDRNTQVIHDHGHGLHGVIRYVTWCDWVRTTL